MIALVIILTALMLGCAAATHWDVWTKLLRWLEDEKGRKGIR